MKIEGSSRATSHKTTRSRPLKSNAPERDAMSKEDRKALVLQYLVHTRLALPPSVLYRNLRLRQNATFGSSTLDNYLEELHEEGLITRIDPEAMEDRELVEIDEGRGYWVATEAGRETASDSFSFTRR